jgi:undecaprenyl-diphosphatase
MPLVQVVVLGIVQGLTEFLPISSSAHLVLISWVMGWADQGQAFDVALHMGTVLAVIVYFFRDWMQILAQGFGLRIGGDSGLARNRGLLWLLALGTLPIGIAGYIFKTQAEEVWRKDHLLIGIVMVVVGLIMWIADRLGRRQKDLSHVSAVDAISIGVAQALAIVPGVSRSGITISAGLFRNLERQEAARFSFLLLTPAVLAAAAKDFYDLMKHQGGIPEEMRVPFILGIAISAIVGGLAIRFLMNFLRRSSLTLFVLYRVVFGIIVIALAVFRYRGG